MKAIRVFPEFKPETHVVTVASTPDWLASGDVVTFYNPKRNTLIVRSLNQTEPRWRRIWRQFRAINQSKSK